MHRLAQIGLLNVDHPSGGRSNATDALPSAWQRIHRLAQIGLHNVDCTNVDHPSGGRLSATEALPSALQQVHRLAQIGLLKGASLRGGLDLAAHPEACGAM